MKFDQKPDNFTNDTADEQKHSTDVPVVHEGHHREEPENKDATQPAKKHHFFGMPKWTWYTILVCIVVLFVAFWLRYLHPSATDNVQTGYITNIEKRGIIFHTGEGDMAVQMNYADSTRTYQRNFNFSVNNPVVFQDLQKLKDSGELVRIHYKTYDGTLPWRGSSTNIVTSVSIVSQP